MTSRSYRRLAIVGGALFVVTATVVGAIVYPIFRSRTGPAAPAAFAPSERATAFVEVTTDAGIRHTHHKPNLDPKLDPIMNWVASVGAAAAAGDFDNDGWMDLYVTDSRKGEPNRLYRNQADGTFVDVAVEAGVAHLNDDSGTSMDCVWGDYDNDGHLDLFVVKWGRDHLFRNQGNGTFVDVTATAFRDENGKPGSPWANGCSAIWVDYDGDARLDLYVGNYFAPFDLWNLEHTRIMHDSFEKARNGGRNFLFHNEGDGTFTEVASRLGLDDPGWTLSVGHGDLNNDGWPDIYCADDFGPDQLFLNRGNGTFENVTDAVIGQDTKKGMNVDFGDLDNDGWLDMYVTNITTAEYLQEGNMLWHNFGVGPDGSLTLVDVSLETGTYDGGWGWGAKLFDYDNDGDQDIVSVNGFITAGEGNYWYDLATWTVTGEDVTNALNWPAIGDRSFSGHEALRLWRNDGDQHFTEVAARAGIDDRRDGRGVVAFDYDNDGDLDLYIANQDAEPILYRNDVGSRSHWLAVKLVGAPSAGSNADAIGARVTFVTASGMQIRELDGGNSYCGQSDRRVFVGLGDEYIVRKLEVRWPSRRVQVLTNVRADQVLTIEEPADLPVVTSLIPTRRSGTAVPEPPQEAVPEFVLSREEREAMLTQLEAQVTRQPHDLAAASKYRAQCVGWGEHKRSTRFFEALADRHATIPNVRLQLSAAYIDEIPTCGGLAAIVSKGTFARRSLDQLDMLINADPQWWPAVYARAMNHLHWPRALRHSAAGAVDFRRCIELQKDSGSPNGRSHYVRAYIGLGDALAKDGDFAEARKAWQSGLDAFPGNQSLTQRVALDTQAEARAFVENVRNLEQAIDTDFSFLLDP